MFQRFIDPQIPISYTWTIHCQFYDNICLKKETLCHGFILTAL